MNDSGSPVVSVGMPVYNGETYLEVAISSVLSQTLSPHVLQSTGHEAGDSKGEQMPSPQ